MYKLSHITAYIQSISNSLKGQAQQMIQSAKELANENDELTAAQLIQILGREQADDYFDINETKPDVLDLGEELYAY